MILKVSNERIASILKNFDIAVSISKGGLSYQIGKVLKNADGILQISGLYKVTVGELLEFKNFPGLKGIAIDLRKKFIGAIVLGSSIEIIPGNIVRGIDKIAEVPVGRSILGTVRTPLGIILTRTSQTYYHASDQRNDSKSRYWSLEYKAPSILDRAPIRVPLRTGVLAVDSMVPIGRGQRELIIGDRQTGKTSLVLDTILSQKKTEVICVYVAIGQKASSVASIWAFLKNERCTSLTVIVAATINEAAAVQYVAPYAGTCVAEYFMYVEKRPTLVIYDDLTKHAMAYREISLLLHRPPGREGYPGDVFYIHSRLLERAAQLNHTKFRGGSMTAIPIIETQAGDVSAYIPTNVISITDGQIYLSATLFNSGVRPAIDVGISVSRVGSNAQVESMKQFAGSLRIDLSVLEELERFAKLSSDIDKSTKRAIARGQRIHEILKQKTRVPLLFFEQVFLLFMVLRGYLNDIPLTDFEVTKNHLLRDIRVLFAEAYRNSPSLTSFSTQEDVDAFFYKKFDQAVWETEYGSQLQKLENPSLVSIHNQLVAYLLAILNSDFKLSACNISVLQFLSAFWRKYDKFPVIINKYEVVCLPSSILVISGQLVRITDLDRFIFPPLSPLISITFDS